MEIYKGPENRKRRKSTEPQWCQYMSDVDKERERIEKLKTVSLADVGLSIRISNILENQGILTVGDLALLTTEELACIPNLGEMTIERCFQLFKEIDFPNEL